MFKLNSPEELCLQICATLECWCCNSTHQPFYIQFRLWNLKINKHWWCFLIWFCEFYTLYFRIWPLQFVDTTVSWIMVGFLPGTPSMFLWRLVLMMPSSSSLLCFVCFLLLPFCAPQLTPPSYLPASSALSADDPEAVGAPLCGKLGKKHSTRAVTQYQAEAN